MGIPVSVIILTKNEEANIASTIAGVRSFDEIVVVDSMSSDNTAAIARELGARVVDFSWDGKYPKKKQWALDHAGTRNDWVLLLDADERPTSALVDELSAIFATRPPNAGAFDISLRYKFAGRYLRHGHTVVKRSLLDRTKTRFPEVDDLNAPGIREVEGHYQPQTKHRVRALQASILHDDRDPVSSWFDRHNRYSDWEAHLNVHKAEKRDIANLRTWRGRLFDRVPFKPALFFAYSYGVRRGFLDGRAGFDYAFALAHYYWQIGLKTRELQRTSAQLTTEPSAQPSLTQRSQQ